MLCDSYTKRNDRLRISVVCVCDISIDFQIRTTAATTEFAYRNRPIDANCY